MISLYDHEQCLLSRVGGVQAVARRLWEKGEYPPEVPAWRVPPSRLARWVQHLWLEMHANLDNLILLDGPEGVGKSSLAMLIAWLFAGDEFQLDRDVAFYDYRDLIDLLDNKTWYRPVISDEAMAYLFNRQSGDPRAIEVINRLFFCRKNRKLIEVLTPNAASVDVVLRRHRARWWIHTDGRSHAELFRAHRKKRYNRRGVIVEPGTITIWRPEFPFSYSRVPPRVEDRYAAIKDDRYDRELVRRREIVQQRELRDRPYLDLK